MTLTWERVPTRHDPRIPFFGILLVYLVLGVTVLGFNRSPAQIGLIIGSACALDMLLHRCLRRRELLFPLSAAISGCSLAILLNFAHGSWLFLLPVFFAIASKYLFTFDGRHVYNPSLFGVIAALFLSDDMISAAPAYQWGGNTAIAAFVVTSALVLFVFRIRRTALIVSFLVFYFMALALRAWITRWHVPPETLFLGALSSPAFYLFTFFMITDPATSPARPRTQVLMGFAIALTDLWLHQFQVHSTLFLAGFIVFTGRWVGLHLGAMRKPGPSIFRRVGSMGRAWVLLVPLGLVAVASHRLWDADWSTVTPGFRFVEVDSSAAGIRSRPSDLLDRVDPRVAHLGKWLLSVGDAVAVNDVNEDGLLDLFLTYPMKHADDRAALYLNRGNFRFQRVPIPAVESLVRNPTLHGIPSGALWYDYDNDGDRDLLVLVGFGKSRLLQNRWREQREVAFIDVSAEVGIDAHTTSVSANALDIDRDGDLDLVIGNAADPWLRDYRPARAFNLFALPEAGFDGDRRMFNFMHRTWYDAGNGGENLVYLYRRGAYRAAPAAALGLGETRWTLDIATADFNADGWTDLYVANDFGPDDLHLNQDGRGFQRIAGTLASELGRDTYKGMNASAGDVDNNGAMDVYVSNMHERLQAEGSLLWMNDGTATTRGADAFRDRAIAWNALNARRFGWGAAMGDLDRDGRLDVVQVNGMVDDSYDKRYPRCPDYWYWNEKIALTSPDNHGYADRWADLRGRCIFPFEKSRVYLNQGDRFADVAMQVGLGQPGNARGVAMADLDNDGDLDLVVSRQFAPVSLYRNEASPARWVGIELRGNGVDCNRDALGTRVVLTGTEGHRQLREVQASNGFSAQGDPRLLFGVPGADGEVVVEISWCGQRRSRRILLEANRYHTVTQSQPQGTLAATSADARGRSAVP